MVPNQEPRFGPHFKVPECQVLAKGHKNLIKMSKFDQNKW